MKLKNSSKIVFTILAMLCAALVFACQPSSTTNSTVNSSTVKNNTSTTSTSPTAETKPPTLTDVPVGNAQTPSEAYRMLFAAVKSQDSNKIKSMLSKGSMGLAEMASGQQKKPVEEIIKNGFSETTFADTYPQMRDERVKDEYGALEVWNEQRKQWEDIPFIKEDGVWKAAFGDAFGGKWKSPGKGQAMIEQENANSANPNRMIEVKPSNTNTNIGGPRMPNKKEK